MRRAHSFVPLFPGRGAALQCIPTRSVGNEDVGTRKRPLRGHTKAAINCRTPNLTEPPGQVVLSLFLRGTGEQGLGGAEFDEHAFEKKRRVVRDPRRLLHVVRDDDDRVLAPQLADDVPVAQRGRRTWRK